MKLPGCLRVGFACHAASLFVLIGCAAVRADLYVVDHPANADYVGQYNATTGAAINSTLVNLPFATGVALGPDGLLYAGTADPGSVFRYNASTGTQVGSGPFVVYNGMPPTPDARDVINPQGMRFGSDGNLYIADEGGNQNIHIYSPTGASLTTLTPPAFFSSPLDIAFDPNGNLYAVGGSGVAEYSFTSHAFTMIVQAATGGPTNPFDLGFGTDGKLYVLDYGTGAVFRYNADGTGQSTFITLDTAFSPSAMTVGPDGKFYISGTDFNTADGEVLQYESNGTFDKVLVTGLNNPGFIAFSVPEPMSTAVIAGAAMILARPRRQA